MRRKRCSSCGSWGWWIEVFRFVFLLTVVIGLLDPAWSRPPPPLEFPRYACPVGGENFEQYESMQNRLGKDGKPIEGDPRPGIRWDIDEFYGVPECPTNGLPMYREFSVDEVARLASLINSSEFKALRKNMPQPMRSFWLATQLGDSIEKRLILLLPANSMSASPKQRRMILEWIAGAFAQVPFGLSFEKFDGGGDSIAAQVYFRLIYVDTLRQLGRFDQAAAELKALPKDRLIGTIPAPITRIVKEGGDEDYEEVINQAEIRRREEDSFRLESIAGMEAALLRRDATPNLLELGPSFAGVEACSRPDAAEFNRANKAYCARPEIAARAKAERARYEASQKPDPDAEARADEDKKKCAASMAELEEIEKLPFPLSPENQEKKEAYQRDQAYCIALDAASAT